MSCAALLAAGRDFSPALYEDKSNDSFEVKITALHCPWSTCRVSFFLTGLAYVCPAIDRSVQVLGSFP